MYLALFPTLSAVYLILRESFSGLLVIHMPSVYYLHPPILASAMSVLSARTLSLFLENLGRDSPSVFVPE